ncbi:uncharacterized protein PGTG_17663 [Puccinia graminis f. sp. tritici CRL 75-36-700-3]|uniref:Uncharacterized protein n=1 Tax=Puccinia graminis f. sp. tritici (strain CRL 75-36-700-3 / race SCCL) TaxID=418459 RepID=E3L4Y4_PUCGT|nr:uncharacterized protein PGTG_17663 [Puccinia graminis f. sp. tritici CRL 75-36-700-3]EFP91609.2 hypothetical protein PGTG_17663 [Puccinia graminis f. sp. tritici CRL 75-36-700-3]
MRIFGTSATFIICGLSRLHQFQSAGNVPHVDAPVSMRSALANETPNVAVPHQSLPLGERPSGTINRSREIILGKAAGPLSHEVINLDDDLPETSNRPGMESQQFQTTGNIPDVHGASASSSMQYALLNQRSRRVDPDRSLPLKEQPTGTTKRPLEIVLASASIPPSHEVIHLDDDLPDINKRPRIERASEEMLTSWYKEMSKNWLDWKDDVIQTTRLLENSIERQRFELTVDTLLRSMSNLFHKKMVELTARNLRTPAKSFQSTDHILSEESGMKNIAKIYTTWKPFYDETKTPEEISTIKKGCDLMIDAFIDLQKFQILTDRRLHDFLNENNGREFILAYVMDRFPFTKDAPVNEMYLNFNIKLSLTEGPSTRKMSNLLGLLEPETWKYIEFHYLMNQMKYMYPIMPESTAGFNEIKYCFLVEASPHKALTSEKLQFLLHKIVTYMSKHSATEKAEFKKRHLVEYKQLYDMLGFLMDYHKHLISLEFQFKHSNILNKVIAFQEGVGLLSSIFHSTYAIETEIKRQKNGENAYLECLTDLNKNRLVTRYKNEQWGEFLQVYQPGASFQQALDVFASKSQKWLTEMLNNEKSIAWDSFMTSKNQLKQYYAIASTIWGQESVSFRHFVLLFVRSFGDIVKKFEEAAQKIQ